MKRLAGLALAALLIAAPSTLAEGQGSVRRAQSLMDNAEYGQAMRVVELALTRADLDDASRADLYWLEATCSISLGKDADAKASFLRLLALRPGHEIDPYTPPKIKRLFEETRTAFAESGGLYKLYQPRLSPVDNVQPGTPTQLTLSFGNPEAASNVAGVTLWVRRIGTSDFNAIDARRTASAERAYVAEIPAFLLAPDAETYGMEYFVDVSDADGRRLTGVGSRALPLTFKVVRLSAPDVAVPTPAASVETDYTPIVIGGIVGGVVLAGGVAATILLLQPGTAQARVVVSQ